MPDQIVIEDSKEDVLPSTTSNFKMESTSKPQKKITQEKAAKPLKAKIEKIMKKTKKHQDEKQILQSVLNQIPLIHQSLCENSHQNKRTTIKLLVQVTPVKKETKSSSKKDKKIGIKM